MWSEREETRVSAGICDSAIQSPVPRKQNIFYGVKILAKYRGICMFLHKRIVLVVYVLPEHAEAGRKIVSREKRFVYL